MRGMKKRSRTYLSSYESSPKEKTLQRSAYLLIVMIVLLALLPVLVSAGDTALMGSGSALPVWASWWLWHGFTHNHSLVQPIHLLYPTGTSILPLQSLTTTAFHVGFGALFGPFAGYHLALAAFAALNAAAGYAFLRAESPNRHAPALATAAALLLAFNPVTWHLAWESLYSLTAIFPLLLLLVLWRRLARQATLAAAALTGAAAALLLLTAIPFWPLLLTGFLPYAWLNRQRFALPSDVVLTAVLVFTGLIAIFPLPLILWAGPAHVYDLDPVVLLPVVPPWMVILLGLAAILLLRRRDGARIWQVIATGNLLLYALGMLLPSGLPLTTPDVFAYPLLLAAAWGLTRHDLQLPAPVPVTLAAVSALAFALLLVRQLTPVPNAALFGKMAADPESYTVLQTPLETRVYGETVSPATNAALLASLWHHKRLFSGLGSHEAVEKARASHQANALTQLAQRAPVPVPAPSDMRLAASELRQTVTGWRVAYFVLDPAADRTLMAWLNWTLSACRVAERVTPAPQAEVWRATWHPQGCTSFTLTPDALRLADTGTGYLLWSRAGYHARLTVTAQTSAQVTVNGQAAGQVRPQTPLTVEIRREDANPDGSLLVRGAALTSVQIEVFR